MTLLKAIVEVIFVFFDPLRLLNFLLHFDITTLKETGMEHFFRAEDGAYDGWAMDVHDLNLKGVDVIGFIEEVDKGRQIQEPRRPK